MVGAGMTARGGLREALPSRRGGHPPAFALLRVPLRFAKGEGRFLAALGMTARGLGMTARGIGMTWRRGNDSLSGNGVGCALGAGRGG